jgi:hypothetical protein
VTSILHQVVGGLATTIFKVIASAIEHNTIIYIQDAKMTGRKYGSALPQRLGPHNTGTNAVCMCKRE